MITTLCCPSDDQLVVSKRDGHREMVPSKAHPPPLGPRCFNAVTEVQQRRIGHRRCPVDTHMAMHHNPGVGVIQRLGDCRYSRVIPRELVTAAGVMCAEPRVVDVGCHPGHVGGVVCLATQVDNVGDSGLKPLVEHALEPGRVHGMMRQVATDEQPVCHLRQVTPPEGRLKLGLGCLAHCFSVSALGPVG